MAARTSKERKVGQHHGDAAAALKRAALALIDDGKPLSLRSVAKEAGVSPAAPYHHFGSKDGLMAAIATEGFDQLGVAIAAKAKRKADPVDALETLLSTYITFAVAHPTHYDIMFDQRLSDASAFPSLHKSASTAFERLAAHVAAASQTPQTGADAAFIWAFSHGVVELAKRGLLQQLLGTSSVEQVAKEAARRLTAIAAP